MSTVKKYQDRFGNWVYRVDIYRENGQRVRETFNSKTEADLYMKEVEKNKRLIKLGVMPEIGGKKRVLLADCIAKYFEDITKKKFSPLAARHDKTVFEKLFDFLVNDAGCEYLDTVTPLIMHNFRESVRDSKVKASTVNRQMGIVHHFFVKCVEWEYRETNPCSKLKKLREITEPRRLWTDVEKTVLLLSGNEIVRDWYLFAEQQGARPAEIEKLQRRRIDFINKQVELHCYKNNGSGFRMMPMTKTTIQMLERRCKDLTPNDYVFTLPNGNRLRSDYVQKRFAEDRMRLGLSEYLTLYGLRHTFATKLNRNQIPTATVQKLLGHSQIRTTLKYAQAGMEDMTRALDTL